MRLRYDLAYGAGSFAAVALEHERESQVRTCGIFIGSFGLAALWGIAHVLRTGQFVWTRRYAQRMVDRGIVVRSERPLAFWLFVLLLAALAAAMFATAAWMILHAQWIASRPHPSSF